MSAVITKPMAKNAYEKNIDERKATVAQITNQYSRKYFNQSNISITILRFAAIKRRLESILLHS
jgi:hypothetical protein